MTEAREGKTDKYLLGQYYENARINWPDVFADIDRRIAALEQENTRLREALEECDRLAEAGLCQFSSGGKHEFLKDIRSHIAERGVQGGITPAPRQESSNMDDKAIEPTAEQIEKFRSSWFANGRDWQDNTPRIIRAWEKIRQDAPESAEPAPQPAADHCPACANGQSLERGEGTHREGTVEHPVEGAIISDAQIIANLQQQIQWLSADHLARLRQLHTKVIEMINRHQDIHSWQPGESRNGLVWEIRDKVDAILSAAVKAKESE